MRKLSVVLASLLLLFSCGGSKESSTNDSNVSYHNPKIINGTEVPESAFPYLVKIILEIEENKFGGCTGTVIAPSVVLTAAHCVANTLSVVVKIGDKTIKASQSLAHDFYLQLPFLVLNDIALIKFDEPLGLPSLPLLGSREVQIGEEVRIAGFGIGGESQLDESKKYGTLRTGLTRVTNKTFFHILTEYNGDGASVCFGDSGGPLLKIFSDGNFAVAGVVSAGTSEVCGPGSTVFFTDVSAFLNEILDVVPDAGIL